jgi:hypothetical protein
LARSDIAHGQQAAAIELLRSAWRAENFDSSDDEAAFLTEFGVDGRWHRVSVDSRLEVRP